MCSIEKHFFEAFVICKHHVLHAFFMEVFVTEQICSNLSQPVTVS